MSFAQQRLWFTDQLLPGSPLFNEAAAVRVHHAIDVPLLEHTINEIIRRHGALRTTFLVRHNIPVQLVHRELPIAIPLTDLRGLPPAEREACALALAREEAASPFTLSTGPLLRVKVYQLDDEDFILTLVMHHIVCDGQSMVILANEIAVIYPALARGEPSGLPEPSVQYADFAVAQRRRVQQEGF